MTTEISATNMLLSAALADHRGGRAADAEAGYRRILAEDPNHPDAVHLLGMLYQRLGRRDEALALLSRAIELDSAAPHFHANLGAALARLKLYPRAIIHLSYAVELRPNYAHAWRNLALCLERSGRPGAAGCAFERLATLQPGDASPWLRAGLAYRRGNQPGASLFALSRVLKIRPDLPAAWHALASAQGDLGRYREAYAAFNRAANLDLDNPHLESDALHLLHYDPAVSRKTMLGAATAWASRHAEPLTRAARTSREPSSALQRLTETESGDPRRLRVGFLSGDFRDHPVGRLAVPTLTHLDRKRFDLICYDDAKRGDAITEELQSLPGITWKRTARVGDAKLAELIWQDQIDILFDWAGHMGGHRLKVFARKPATVQITQFNYPDTTGMTAMNWRMSDDLAEPSGVDNDAYSVERLCRLGSCAWCYSAGDSVPEVEPLPAQANGYVTFGSLNKPLKHSAPTVALWAKILTAVPRSKLMLLGLADERENVLLYEPFSRHDIDRERLIFVERRPRQGYLEQYGRVDIALDPFPYNGGITSCDGLYMGVPLVTLAGETYHSRQGLMLLTNLGLPELIANNKEAYTGIAVELAGDLGRLAKLRAGLRQRMIQSPMMDGPAFAVRVGSALEQIWQEHVAGDVLPAE